MLSDQGAKRIAKIWFCAEKRRTDEKDLAASKAYADVDEIIGGYFLGCVATGNIDNILNDKERRSEHGEKD